MLCTIDDFQLADGTISGGWSLTDLRLKITRICDVVIPLGELNPVPMDRNKRRADVSFSVARIHDTIKAAEEYILDHDATIPRTGDAKLIVSVYGITTSNPYALIINGALVSHELVQQIGKFTLHAYTLQGAPLFPVVPDEPTHITTEDVDRITTETGDTLVIE